MEETNETEMSQTETQSFDRTGNQTVIDTTMNTNTDQGQNLHSTRDSHFTDMSYRDRSSRDELYGRDMNPRQVYRPPMMRHPTYLPIRQMSSYGQAHADMHNRISSIQKLQILAQQKNLSLDDMIDIQTWTRPLESPSNSRESYTERMKRLAMNYIWHKMQIEGTSREDILKVDKKRWEHNGPNKPMGPPKVQRLVPTMTPSMQKYWQRNENMPIKQTYPEAQNWEATGATHGSYVNQYLQPTKLTIGQVPPGEPKKVDLESLNKDNVKNIAEEIAETQRQSNINKETITNLVEGKDDQKENKNENVLLEVIDDRIDQYKGLLKGIKSLADNLKIDLGEKAGDVKVTTSDLPEINLSPIAKRLPKEVEENLIKINENIDFRQDIHVMDDLHTVQWKIERANDIIDDKLDKVIKAKASKTDNTSAIEEAKKTMYEKQKELVKLTKEAQRLEKIRDEKPTFIAAQETVYKNEHKDTKWRDNPKYTKEEMDEFEDERLRPSKRQRDDSMQNQNKRFRDGENDEDFRGNQLDGLYDKDVEMKDINGNQNKENRQQNDNQGTSRTYAQAVRGEKGAVPKPTNTYYEARGATGYTEQQQNEKSNTDKENKPRVRRYLSNDLLFQYPESDELVVPGTGVPKATQWFGPPGYNQEQNQEGRQRSKSISETKYRQQTEGPYSPGYRSQTSSPFRENRNGEYYRRKMFENSQNQQRKNFTDYLTESSQEKFKLSQGLMGDARRMWLEGTPYFGPKPEKVDRTPPKAYVDEKGYCKLLPGQKPNPYYMGPPDIVRRDDMKLTAEQLDHPDYCMAGSFRNMDLKTNTVINHPRDLNFIKDPNWDVQYFPMFGKSPRHGTYIVDGVEFEGPVEPSWDTPMLSNDELLYWANKLAPRDWDTGPSLNYKKYLTTKLFNYQIAKQKELEDVTQKHALGVYDRLEENKVLTNRAEWKWRMKRYGIPDEEPRDKIQMKSTQEEQLRQIAEKAKTDSTVASTNEIMLELINHIASNKPRDTYFDYLMKNATKNIEDQTVNAAITQAQLEGSKTLANKFENNLQRPKTIPEGRWKLGIDRRLEPANILKAIKSFNPENQNADFSDTWRHILSYTSSIGVLTEKEYIDILLLVMQGQAHRDVFDMSQSNASLNEILDTLADLYVPKRYITDDIQALNKFKRLANEPIYRTIGRAKLLVSKLKHLYPKTWNEENERILMSILKQTVAEPTYNFIVAEEIKKLKLGVRLDLKSTLDMVDTYENSHNTTPKNDKYTTVNACSSVIIGNEQPKIKEEYQQKVDKLEQIVFGINAMQVNDRGSGDRRSVKERTRSRSSERRRENNKPYSRATQNQLRQSSESQERQKPMEAMEVEKSKIFTKPNISYNGYDKKQDYRNNQQRDEKQFKREMRSISRESDRDEKRMVKYDSQREQKDYQRGRPENRYESQNNYNKYRERSYSNKSNTNYGHDSRRNSYSREDSRSRGSYRNYSREPSKDRRDRSYSRDSRRDSRDRNNSYNRRGSRTNIIIAMVSQEMTAEAEDQTQVGEKLLIVEITQEVIVEVDKDIIQETDKAHKEDTEVLQGMVNKDHILDNFTGTEMMMDGTTFIYRELKKEMEKA